MLDLRLKESWEELPEQYTKVCSDFQELVIDPLLEIYQGDDLTAEEASEAVGRLYFVENPLEVWLNADDLTAYFGEERLGGTPESISKVGDAWMIIILISNDEGLVFCVPNEILLPWEVELLEEHNEPATWISNEEA